MSAMAARIVLATKLFVGVFGEILWSGTALAVALLAILYETSLHR